jgi:hypothetical protein
VLDGKPANPEGVAGFCFFGGVLVTLQKQGGDACKEQYELSRLKI